tara:strand:+ start:562 stop:684 length:123 start_codon:yes stop_codon:yes gene_type:complete
MVCLSIFQIVVGSIALIAVVLIGWGISGAVVPNEDDMDAP